MPNPAGKIYPRILQFKSTRGILNANKCKILKPPAARLTAKKSAKTNKISAPAQTEMSFKLARRTAALKIQSMNPKDAEREMSRLAAQLRKHEALYRLHNNPEISDVEYDKMMRKLSDLESAFPQLKRADSPTLRIGSDLQSGFAEVEHLSPMQSLDNAFSLEDLKAFESRLTRALSAAGIAGVDGAAPAYCIEPKIDGAGISAVYEDGRLTRLLTRGDGVKGNDISPNAFLIRNLPLRLKGNFPELLEVRGECYMTVEEFERIKALSAENSAKAANGAGGRKSAASTKKSSQSEKFLGYANPRNLAAGTMKLLPKTFQENPVLKERKLLCVFYSIGAMEGFVLHRQSELPQTLASWGLPCVDWHTTANGVEAALKRIAEFDSLRSELPYNTDGAVLKLDDISLHSAAGATEKAPRWAIAWKYPAERKRTRLLGISENVGRTGLVTPVAELEPVWISGSTVSRATLHNVGYIAQRDIRVGDMVVVEKAGEIIPAVVDVDFSARSPDSRPYSFPTHCPKCGSKLMRFGEKTLYRCPNFSCPMQVRARLIHFASRGCMDIEGLAEKTIDTLIEACNIDSPADLYELDAHKLVSQANLKDPKTLSLSKSGSNLLKSIEESKTRPLWRLIFALGIPEIGAQFAKELAKKFGSLDALMAAPLEEIESIEGFGSKSQKAGESVRALSIRAFFEEAHNIKTIQRLRAAGLNFKDGDAEKRSGGAFEGKVFVLTGKLSGMGRERAQAEIESLGGKSASSVSSKTDYLVAAQDPSENKLSAAKKFGVKIIAEKEFLEMLGPDPSAPEPAKRQMLSAGPSEGNDSAGNPTKNINSRPTKTPARQDTDSDDRQMSLL